ncbi:class I SAM-dependent methyltransferase [Mangrovicella endophytica]|uniref:class I SAM-dependent methyltransferase n=1 Tax=Mangrovicella endophytica TaxID=2066697 RepID=UPI000C9DD6D1|nr:class I SAM-dependent methyltransferase [Mangrovicella endophytica]
MVETDWNTYYAQRKSSGSPTRKITQRLLLGVVNRFKPQALGEIMEFGGGDSCFYPAFRRTYPSVRYTIVDKSHEGVAKFQQKYGTDNVDALEADLLAEPSLPASDLVYSIGLIEHFDPDQTARIIRAHFAAAKPGALVVITYPTPTTLYRTIRGAAEMLGIWRFPDERPLFFDEVNGECAKHGILLFRKLNWAIGLTQELVAYRKRS